MNFLRRQFLQLAGASTVAPALPQLAFALDYPTRPVRVIVPFGPGGPTDVFTRLITQKLSERFGKQFYLENKPGAGSNLGTGEAGYVSSNATRPDGNSLWGENANGLFILTESGHFSWQVFRSDRPKFASNNRLNVTPDELKATNQGSLAYFGTYSVDEADKTVTFRTQASTFPNSEGEVLKRIVTKLTADELIYTNPATTLGLRIEAVWKRIK